MYSCCTCRRLYRGTHLVARSGVTLQQLDIVHGELPPIDGHLTMAGSAGQWRKCSPLDRTLSGTESVTRRMQHSNKELPDTVHDRVSSSPGVDLSAAPFDFDLAAIRLPNARYVLDTGYIGSMVTVVTRADTLNQNARPPSAMRCVCSLHLRRDVDGCFGSSDFL